MAKDIDWVSLNKWRWNFLRISPEYAAVYDKLEQNKITFDSAQIQLAAHFNLLLSDPFYGKKELPHPDKDIEKITKQIKCLPLVFIDYDYHFTRRSSMMAKVFGRENADPCLDITEKPDKNILLIKQVREIGWFTNSSAMISETTAGPKEVTSTMSLPCFYRSKRILPGLRLFAVDINVPIEDLIDKFKQDILTLKKTYRIEEQRKSFPLEAIKKYWCAYMTSEGLQHLIRYEDCKILDKATKRDIKEWTIRGRKLVKQVAKGTFILPV